MTNSVSIIDYGVGNINSVANMLRRAGAEVTLARSPSDVRSAKRLILPGVGAFDACKKALDAVPGLESAIRDYANAGHPLLGICVGMQLLAASSEEGILPGLNIIPGQVKKFAFQQDMAQAKPLKVPHMGWSSIRPTSSNPLYCEGLAELNRFYFVHSYYFEATNEADVAAWCHYGFNFAASVRKANVYGAQFHPEKSHKFGLKFFKNFVQVPST